MAFGQQALTCFPGVTLGVGTGSPITPQVPIELRSEGATELVSDVLGNCNAAPVGSTTGQVTATLSATGILGVTSKVLNTSTGLTDATLTVTDTVAATTVYYQGIVSGNTVTFGTAATPVTFPTHAFTLQVSNVRVNVTGQYPNNLQPVTETVQLIAQGNGLAAVTNLPAAIVGNQRNSLSVKGSASTPYIAPGTTSVAGTASSSTAYLVCSASTSGSPVTAFSLTISELFPGAFKTQVQDTLGTSTPAVFSVAGIPGSESGSLLGVGAAGTGTATSGTRIKLIFSGIPTNAAVYVPTTITGVGGAGFILSLTTGGETGAFTAATTPSGAPAGTAPIVNNTAIYEVTEADYTALGSFTVTPIVTYASNAVTLPAGPVTVAVSYAPSPATSGASLASPIPTIPYFANTSTTLTGSTFTACSTTLIFPFVTNESSFETGIAIANTGLDYLNPTGKVTSVATGQSGACTISFFGSTGAEGGTQAALPTAPNFPASTKTPATIAPGTTHADTLTDIIGGPFQGYAIATCPFLYAKGFAFIEYGLATSNGVVEGYLADVVTSTRQSSVTATVPVASGNPESSGQ
jgi:hypothetical protein